MAVKMKKDGYAQLEPNRLSAQKTKEIFGQLPLDDAVTLCEQGMALVYDEVAGKVTLPKTGKKVCLVYNEFILEDERKQQDKDFAIKNRAENERQTANKAYPRLYGLHVGDTFHTNAVMLDNAEAEVTAGDVFVADATTGYWVKSTDEGAAEPINLKVVKNSTMPDGQRGIKFVVSKA